MIRAFKDFFLLLIQRRGLIWELAVRDIAQKYAGSWLGLTWTVIHPLSLILIFWFVFGFGLKARPIGDVPFTVWLTSGMAVWFSFSEIVAESTNAVTGNPHMVKKMLFPSQILPVVKVVSSFLNHMVFLALLIILILIHRMPFSLYYLQALYYYLCMACLALGMGWLTSAINVFTRDTNQFIQLFLQVLFWTTPIIWDIGIMPQRIQALLKLNPVYYLVQGYRDSFITFTGFWQHPLYSLYFWGFTLTVMLAGALVFKKLKPHFDDVL